MEPTGDYINYLQREWSLCGALALHQHGVESDFQAIYDWVGWFIVNGAGDPEYRLILTYIDHSLYSDIPFEATSTVRESLITAARSRLKDSPHSRDGMARDARQEPPAGLFVRFRRLRRFWQRWALGIFSGDHRL